MVLLACGSAAYLACGGHEETATLIDVRDGPRDTLTPLDLRQVAVSSTVSTLVFVVA